MDYRYGFVAKDRFPQIYETFTEAFADYYVDAGHLTEQVLFNRAVKDGVDFEASVGVFYGSKMVGITLIGIDRWGGVPAAFDAGTGVVPNHRGKGVARAMLDFAVPKLRRRGVKRFILEVLQINEPAVKVYRQAGFHVTREFDCFTLELDRVERAAPAKSHFEIRPVGKDGLDAFKDMLDWQPSWENSFSSVVRTPDDVVLNGAFAGTECIGLLVYYPLLNWIMSLVTKREFRRKGVATGLIAHLAAALAPSVSEVKLNNVDHSDTGMLAFLERTGFRFAINQYEMARDL